MNIYGSASQFDPNSAFSGGGFMSSQATQTFDSGASPAKNRDSNGLFPLTVKQIHDSITDGDKLSFKVNEKDVMNVKLLGMVLQINNNATYANFVLDDGTGRIPCQKWIGDNTELQEMEGLQDGMYVRVHGQMKDIHNKKKIVVFAVRPVTDFNEIAYHFIECIHVHVSNTRAQGGAHTQAQGGIHTQTQGGFQTQNQMGNSAMNTPVRNTPVVNQAPVANQHTGPYAHTGNMSIADRVMEFLNDPKNQSEQGVHISELAQHLRLPQEKIRETIQLHINEGTVYSTISDDHFKSTLNG